MTSKLITHLEEFDRNGIHIGSARLDVTGKWLVRLQVMSRDHVCETEQAAWNFLQMGGAATIQESDGKK